ncbi:DUF3419 family protein [Salisaeta longa]|uniref:DUF3419 family protein n=1 Tax=Salisaeta longa TaxID=503170 RepID=UPI000491EF4B|nr:BtaA family protein [Salisaeta longa]
MPSAPSVRVPSVARLLPDAVQQSPTVSRRGLLERLFTTWFDGWVYNQIWEDPRVDARALQLDGNSRVLTIASGGCNVLNYLGHGPERITALDLNPAHLALTRLKLTALRRVPSHDAFYDLFGHGDRSSNVSIYTRHLQPHLDDDTRAFWTARRGLRRQRRYHVLASGLYDRSRMGLFLRFVHGVARQMGLQPERLLQAQTLAGQRAFYQRVVAPFFERRWVAWLTQQPATVFSLGIPPQQHRFMAEESRGGVLGLFRQRLRTMVCEFPIQDNYFAWQVFGRRYDHTHRRAIPPYLRAEAFPALRERAGRVDTHVASYADYLAAQPTGAYNAFVLLDAQDWMTPSAIARLWREIARVGGAGARVIFRTAGTRSPVEAALPTALRSRFTYHRMASERLHAHDRSAIYGMFHLYECTA